MSVNRAKPADEFEQDRRACRSCGRHQRRNDSHRRVVAPQPAEPAPSPKVWPPSDATVRTDAGWAFINVNGYLGTVTADGEVIDEPGLGVD